MPSGKMKWIRCCIMGRMTITAQRNSHISIQTPLESETVVEMVIQAFSILLSKTIIQAIFSLLCFTAHSASKLKRISFSSTKSKLCAAQNDIRQTQAADFTPYERSTKFDYFLRCGIHDLGITKIERIAWLCTCQYVNRWRYWDEIYVCLLKAA